MNENQKRVKEISGIANKDKVGRNASSMCQSCIVVKARAYSKLIVIATAPQTYLRMQVEYSFFLQSLLILSSHILAVLPPFCIEL